MPDDSPKTGTDLFGLQPFAKSVEIATQGVVDLVEAILSRVCYPVAKEYGQLLKEKVHHWRQCNLLVMTKKLEEKMAANQTPTGAHAHPRIAHTIVEEASWIDDSAVQDMWAGLLASACTEGGDDDSNLIFTNLLGSLTKLQAKILKYACETATKQVSSRAVIGLIHAADLYMTIEELHEISGEKDLQRLDRELDHLRSLELVAGGINIGNGLVDLTPTTLALHMYVRCQGSRKSPLEFFGLTVDPPLTPDELAKLKSQPSIRIVSGS